MGEGRYGVGFYRKWGNYMIFMVKDIVWILEVYI